MFNLDILQIASQAISFAILLFILKRFAWKPLLSILDQRRHRIEEELRQIALRQAELSRLQEDYGKRLSAIEEEARAKIQQAIIEGKKVAVEIQEQARAQGHSLVNKAKETIELEMAKAKVTLRDQMVGITVDAMERVLRQKADASADKKLVEAVMEELEREHAQG